LQQWKSAPIGNQKINHEQLLRSQPKQFLSQAKVMLGLAEVGHLVGRGLGADNFD
jgi:hypothetical protein